jgi:hypothetical protein
VNGIFSDRQREAVFVILRIAKRNDRIQTVVSPAELNHHQHPISPFGRMRLGCTGQDAWRCAAEREESERSA